MTRRATPFILALLIAGIHPDVPGASRPDSSRTPADSLAGAVETLFMAAKYDSLLGILPGFIRRAEATGDSVLLGRALAQRGRVLLVRGRLDDGERDVDLGIEIAEALRDTVGLMPAVHFKGLAWSMRGRYDEAMRCLERRLLLAQLTRSPVDEAWARSSIAMARHYQNRHEEARQEFVRSIELFEAGGRPDLAATPLIGLGRVMSALGNGDEAIACYQRAWVEARKAGDRINEMWATNNLGVMEEGRGDLSRAAQYQQRAFALARELKYPNVLIIPALNMANRAQELGDFEAAETILSEARALCEAEGATGYLGLIDFSIAELRMRQGRNHAAAAMLREFVAHPEKLDVQHRDDAVADLATVLAASDSLDAAIALLSRHTSRDQPMFGDVAPRANLLLAGFYLRTGDGARALVHALHARDLAQTSGKRRIAVAAMLSESICRRVLGQPEAAALTLYAALDSLETFRSGVSTADWREVYGQEVSRRVVEAARVLREHPTTTPQRDRDAAFFDATRRVKTRTLIDRITAPRLAGDAGAAGPPPVVTLQDVQPVLLPGEVVLDYCVGIQQSFLAVVTRDSLRVFELPGPDSPLAERVALLRSVLASSDPALRAQYPPDRVQTMLAALSGEVLDGAADVVARSSRVFVSPDGYFASVPFGALVMGGAGEALMAGRDVVQIPSLSVLVRERSAADRLDIPRATVVAIGPADGRLSGARRELRNLASSYADVRVVNRLTGIEAFEEASRDCDVLHIAAHALIVDRSPWESGIRVLATEPAAPEPADSGERADAPPADSYRVLSAADSLLVARTFRGDPYLRAWQIAPLGLRATLAVLAACETAGGRVTTGEGTLGITAAFMSAGVPVVVSSLWPVDDDVTAVVMQRFYRHLAAGEPVATALRLAQMEVSRTRDHAHPFYWAGFTVVGDGSIVIGLEERWGAVRPVLLALACAAVLAGVAVLLRRRRHGAAPA